MRKQEPKWSGIISSSQKDPGEALAASADSLLKRTRLLPWPLLQSASWVQLLWALGKMNDHEPLPVCSCLENPFLLILLSHTKRGSISATCQAQH